MRSRLLYLLFARCLAEGVEWLPPVALDFGGSAAGAVEQTLNAGPSELRLILTGDSWSSRVGIDEEATRPLVEAFTSLRPSEPAGWAAMVTPVLNASMVQRTSAHELSIGLPALPCFDILSPEAVMLTVPSVAIASGRKVVAPPLLVHADTSVSPPRWGSVRSTPVEVWRNCTHIRVDWTRPAYDGGTELVHYQLEFRSLNSPSSAWSVGPPNNVTAGVVGPLERNSTYSVRVRPFNRGSGCTPVPGSAGAAAIFVAGWRADELHTAAGPARGGAVSGGIGVSVVGACMYAANGSECVWGGEDGAPRTPVVRSNETHLECASPAVADTGPVRLLLSLSGSAPDDGQPAVGRDSGLDFEFYSLQLTALYPLAGAVDGGTRIRVSLTFEGSETLLSSGPTQSAVCRMEGGGDGPPVSSPAIHFSYEEVICLAPPVGPPSTVLLYPRNISVSLDGGVSFFPASGDGHATVAITPVGVTLPPPSGRIHFYYYNATISTLSPAGGPLRGGTAVLISATGLASPEAATPFVRFGLLGGEVRSWPLAPHHSPRVTPHAPLATCHLPRTTRHVALTTHHSPRASLHVPLATRI